jgi:hypothetical protein
VPESVYNYASTPRPGRGRRNNKFEHDNAAEKREPPEELVTVPYLIDTFIVLKQ